MVSRRRIFYADVTLVDGSAVTAELPNNSSITVGCTGYTLPTITRAAIPYPGGGRADRTVRGRLAVMTLSLTMSEMNASMDNVGRDYTVEIRQDLATEGGAVIYDTWTMTGRLLAPTPGPVALGGNEIRTRTYTYELRQVKQVRSNLTTPITDIDTDSGVYKQNGIDMFAAG